MSQFQIFMTGGKGCRSISDFWLIRWEGSLVPYNIDAFQILLTNSGSVFLKSKTISKLECLQSYKKNPAYGTPTVLTDADSRTDTNLKRLSDLSKKKKGVLFLKVKKKKKEEEKNLN